MEQTSLGSPHCTWLPKLGKGQEEEESGGGENGGAGTWSVQRCW